MFTGFQRTFHLLIITSSDYNTQCLSVSIHYLLLQLVIQIRTECLPHMGRLFYQLNYVRCLHLMYLKKWQSGWVTLPHKAVLETAAFLVCHHLVKMVSPPLIFQWPYLLLSVNYEINVVDSDFFFASLTET